MEDKELQEMYRRRFTENLCLGKRCGRFCAKTTFNGLFRLAPQVLEIGAGYCEFINSILWQAEFAVDINPETLNKARNDVEVIIAKSTDLASINQESMR